MDMETIEQLEAFFADLTSRPQAVRFRGVELETFYGGPHRGIFALLSTMFEAVIARFAGERRGIHVRVWLPVAVSADLLLETRPAPTSGDDPLDSNFAYSTSSERKVRAYLEGAVLEALAQLQSEYAITMTDRHVEIGPLLGSPAASATAIATLVDALPRPPEGVRAPEEADPDAEIEPVSVATTTSRMQADMWRSLLDAVGIPCHVHGYEQSPPWGAATPMRPIDLLVPTTHEEHARRIIGEAGALEPPESFCYSCGASLPEGAEWCPECRIKLETDSTDPPEKL
jgi:hypothetical protein